LGLEYFGRNAKASFQDRQVDEKSTRLFFALA